MGSTGQKPMHGEGVAFEEKHDLTFGLCTSLRNIGNGLDHHGFPHSQHEYNGCVFL